MSNTYKNYHKRFKICRMDGGHIFSALLLNRHPSPPIRGKTWQIWDKEKVTAGIWPNYSRLPMSPCLIKDAIGKQGFIKYGLGSLKLHKFQQTRVHIHK
ncbi:hypothetical protein M8C21_003132 [Ambrosia artemisiifolia]|uniref:Uncharacterized protein n=1 Tax=Ambrosia artemisiifolia TaxID=4212 RepID=A0AAD5GQZ1_AMBAR|nr:hypothetical protein M8C21_003132 [Ambrosia artemisiifolia]